MLDAAWLLERSQDERHNGLVPDLDTYLSELAGYRSWGKRILQWSEHKIERVEQRLRQSFFERHTIYAELLPLPQAPEAQDVRHALTIGDDTRYLSLAAALKGLQIQSDGTVGT
jgi:hypothetical protein